MIKKNEERVNIISGASPVVVAVVVAVVVVVVVVVVAVAGLRGKRPRLCPE